MFDTTETLPAVPSLGVIIECLDPWVPHPPKVTIDVKRVDGDLPRWVTSWRLIHNLDHDGGDTEQLEVTYDRGGLEWAISNGRSGAGIESLLNHLFERAVRS